MRKCRLPACLPALEPIMTTTMMMMTVMAATAAQNEIPI